MTIAEIRPPVKWWGGKHYLQGRIIALMPPDWKRRHQRGDDHVFVETHGGMGSVILNKPPCDVEVFNDIDLRVWNLFDVLKYEPEEFKRLLALTPCHQEEFADAKDVDELRAVGVVGAVAFYTRMRQSFGGKGGSFSYTKFRSRKGMADVVSGWLSSIEENLPLVVSRLTEIEHVRRDDALTVIRDFDSERTFFYSDPPYCHGTRATTEDYAHEMTETQHFDLLKLLGRIKGKFILSGYRNPMYDGDAERFGWRRVDIDMANHAAGGKEKRRMTEALYMNYAAPEEA